MKYRRTQLFLAFTAAILLAIVVSAVLPAKKALAVTGADWHPGRIIDDSVFTNINSMGVAQIQQFLTAKVTGGTCDTNGTQLTGRAKPGGGYYTRAEWGALNSAPAPYVCLYQYPGAAQTIFNAGHQYNINPQVLIVLLQKEQSLVTDDWPWPIQYSHATGAYCPDTAPCDPAYSGFNSQVFEAARLFRYYMNTPWLYFIGNNNVRYNPNAACGSSNVYIENAATEALYHYTPYQPNQAALNNLYGTGDSCSAYGNRNFWRMFNDWFGSTTGPEYSWSIESFTYSGGDNNVAVGETETLTLKARNTSRHPWYNHGANPVRLGTWQPGRVSPLASGSWLTNSRPANLVENMVDIGDVGTFTFNITPGTAGSFVEGLNLVLENYTWMSWTGLSPTINVVNPNAWSIESVSYGNGTGVMDVGSQQLITVRARNIGSSTWSKAGPAPVRLGTWQPQRQSSLVTSGWLSSTRVVDMNEATVAPGEIAGFQFYARMPSSGNYYERFNLVKEGITWFNDPGLTLYLHGKTYAWQPVWQSISTSNVNITRNQNFVITIRVRNTGEMAWKKTDPFKVRLATVAPQNRGSALYHPDWIDGIRPATLIDDVVLPGQEGTISFNARTPATPGPRNERFSLVAEGIQWFNDPGFNIYINVL